MSPFSPINGLARWRTIYQLLEPMQPGAILTYERMGEALDLHPDSDRHTIQMAMRRAAKQFEFTHKHAVMPEPNLGYRVVEAPEHLTLAKSQQSRASRSLIRGHSKVVNVDLSHVDPEVRNAFQVVAQAFSMQMEMSRRLDTRQRNLETAVNSITQRQERSDDELAELRERLARIERQTQQ